LLVLFSLFDEDECSECEVLGEGFYVRQGGETLGEKGPGAEKSTEEVKSSAKRLANYITAGPSAFSVSVPLR